MSSRDYVNMPYFHELASKAKPPEVLFPPEKFMPYVGEYYGLFTIIGYALAQLHPDQASVEVLDAQWQTLGTVVLGDESPYEAWKDTNDELSEGEHSVLHFVAQMDSSLLRVSTGKSYDSEMLDYVAIFAERENERLHGVAMRAKEAKEQWQPEDESMFSSIKCFGRAAVRTAAGISYMPYAAFGKEMQQGVPSIASMLIDRREAHAYEQYGHEGLFAMQLWGMGRELCRAIDLQPPVN